MATYQAWQVTGNRQFDWVERELVEPDPGQARVRVLACGVCHSDMVAAEGLLRDPSVPVVPGHEIVGEVDAVGDGVRRHKVGDLVGVGYLGGHCYECEMCRRGDFVNCQDQPHIGRTHDAVGRNMFTSGPGPIETEAYRALSPIGSEREARVLNDIPLHRVGTPAEVAHLICMVLDDDAGYMTGQILRVDGGGSISAG